MKGKNFLKVTGILMIIFGVIAIILSTIGLIAWLQIQDSFGEAGTLMMVALILYIISGVLELIAGIVGIKFCKRPEKAGTCIAFGVVVLLLAIAGLVIDFMTMTSVNILNIVTNCIAGVAIPVLYIIGAVLNKKQAITSQNDPME